MVLDQYMTLSEEKNKKESMVEVNIRIYLNKKKEYGKQYRKNMSEEEEKRTNTWKNTRKISPTTSYRK